VRGYSMHFRFCLLAVGLLLTACAAGRIRDHVYISAAKAYRVRLPAEAWDVEVGKEADLVLRHQSGQAGIVVNATCDEILQDRPLEIEMRRLFFGIRGKELLRQERHTKNPGEAVEMVLRGELDGRSLLFHGYTLKASGCLYDLVLFAPSEHYAEVNEEFEALVDRFQLSKGEKR
jgi:hypothetical protein